MLRVSIDPYLNSPRYSNDFRQVYPALCSIVPRVPRTWMSVGRSILLYRKSVYNVYDKISTVHHCATCTLHFTEFCHLYPVLYSIVPQISCRPTKEHFATLFCQALFPITYLDLILLRRLSYYSWVIIIVGHKFCYSHGIVHKITVVFFRQSLFRNLH